MQTTYKNYIAIFVVFLIGNYGVVSQNNLILNKKVLERGSERLDLKFEAYQIYKIDTKPLLSQIKNKKDAFDISFNFSDIKSWNLQLSENNLLSRNFRITAQTKAGRTNVELPLLKVLKGTTTENGSVRLTIGENYIAGFIEKPDGIYYIEPLKNILKGEPDDVFILYNASLIKENTNLTCLAEELKSNNKKRQLQKEIKPISGECFTAKIAIANDYLMYEKYTTSPFQTVEMHNISLLNAVQENYDDEFDNGIFFEISEIFTSNCDTCDPWTNSTGFLLLQSFTGWGNSNGFSNYYDLASLWTARQFAAGNGIAWNPDLSQFVCNSKRYNVNFDESAFPLFNSLRALWSHEIGHTFGAQHDLANSPHIMDESSSANSTTWSSTSIQSINQRFLNSLTEGCFEQLDNCPCLDNSQLSLSSNINSGQNITESAGIITATNTVFPNGTGVFKGGNGVVLKPGFWAKNSSNFRAIIECNSDTKAPVTTITNKQEKEIPTEKIINIYPNPTTGHFTIGNSELDIVDWEIMNQYGSKVASNFGKSIQNPTITIDLTNQRTGIYFIRIMKESGNTFSKSIIKR